MPLIPQTETSKQNPYRRLHINTWLKKKKKYNKISFRAVFEYVHANVQRF